MTNEEIEKNIAELNQKLNRALRAKYASPIQMEKATRGIRNSIDRLRQRLRGRE